MNSKSLIKNCPSFQNQLIDMMSIGTLLAYTIVAVCVVVLRYREQDDHVQCEKTSLSSGTIFRQLFNLNFVKHPNSLTSNITKMALVAYCFSTIIVCILIDVDRKHYPWADVCLYTIIPIMLMEAVIVARQPQCNIYLTFKVPFVPLLPLVSIFLNLYLMCQLDVHTWFRFGFWMVIGYAIFITYSMPSSLEKYREKIELSENGTVDKVSVTTQNHHGHSNGAYVCDSTCGPTKL